MTETSPTATHSTAHLFPVTASTSPSLPNGTHSAHQEEEEEPYTIKCICIYDDDDGSTVFCERCETWQHIVCYYDDKEVPEIHNCSDCEPRPLDSKRATDRQKRRREQNDSGDRKGKRGNAKYQKKKNKELAATGDIANGWSSNDKNSAHPTRDQPPPIKKQRTSHRSSASISSVAGTPLLNTESRKRGPQPTATVPSPTKASTNTPIPLYSQEFLHLYDNDQVDTNIPGNLFEKLEFTDDLASWSKDPSALANVANGRSAKDVFTYFDHPLDPSKWPPISKQSATDTSIDCDGLHPSWRFLKVEANVRKDEVVGEIRGKVGHLRDYCYDPTSRWQELRHPEPFVFFHPQLPIYIDSRKGGTLLRYIRRSCRPNVTLKTFITNETEYHFCFVANQDISSDSEITATWYLDPKLFPTNNSIVKEESPNEGTTEAAAITLSNVLAHFGGCACDSSQPCLLANVDRRTRPRAHDSKQANGRRKRTKAKTNGSPVSTGHATNSRAGSEARKPRDDEDVSENRSVSGSVRDHPDSRDLTPTAQSPAGEAGVNGTELSAREKRKIAAAEKKFEQLEHDQQHGQKKRRRNAAGVSISKLPGPPKPPRLDTVPSRRSPSTSNKASPASAYSRLEARSTPKTSASSTPRVGSPLIRSDCVDSSIQTESEFPPGFPSPASQFCFASPARRLLSRHRLHRNENHTLKAVPAKMEVMEVDDVAPPKVSEVPLSPESVKDVEMKDASPVITPQKPIQPDTVVVDHPPVKSSGPSLKQPLSPLPSTAAHNLPIHNTPIIPEKKLDIQPILTQLPTPAVSTTDALSGGQSPRIEPPKQLKPRGPSTTLTPGLGITTPSPVKKRMSLGDYMSRKGNMNNPAADKSQSNSLTNGQHQQQSSPLSHSVSSADIGQNTLAKPVEEVVKRDPDMCDTVMQDAPALSTYPETSSSPSNSHSLSRDPRF